MNRIKKITGRIGSIAEGSYFIWGVLIAGWSPMLMAAGYWIEEAVMFIVTAAALVYIRLKKGGEIFLGRYLFIYGFFFFVHSIFFVILAAITSGSDAVSDELFEASMDLLLGHSIYLPSDLSVTLALTLLVVLISVIYTVAYRVKSTSGNPAELINRSFGALIASHLLLIFGAGGIILTGIPYALAVVLVIIKLLVDMTGFSGRGSVIVSSDEVVAD